MASAQFAGSQLARHTTTVTTATTSRAIITANVVLTARGGGDAVRAKVQLLHPVIPQGLLQEAYEDEIG